MEKQSNSNNVFSNLLSRHEAKGILPKKFHAILEGFFYSYESVLRKKGLSPEKFFPIIEQFLHFVEREIKAPFTFQPFHKQVLDPDYYTFGKEFIRPLVEFSSSTIGKEENIKQIDTLIKQGENVILLANHQIEADPHVLFLTLEKEYESLAKNMIFVAGERVITDPLAIPFSMGCNLFCIFSKKYIDNPPEKKHEKQLHNKKVMDLMRSKLSEGGQCIYVAPSGGRDRRGPSGRVEIAPFDPQSLEMFHLMARKALKPTHFFPLSLATFSLLPPPEDIQIELGEERKTTSSPVHVYFGEEIDMVHFEGNDPQDKINNRKARAKYIHNLVCQAYKQFPITY